MPRVGFNADKNPCLAYVDVEVEWDQYHGQGLTFFFFPTHEKKNVQRRLRLLLPTGNYILLWHTKIKENFWHQLEKNYKL